MPGSRSPMPTLRRADRAQAAEQFSAFDLEAAGDFAERKNRQGFNIYVGVALRQGERQASNGRASGANVLTHPCRAWTDFDGEGDAGRVEAILEDKDIRPAEVVTTGTIPDRRFQVHFEPRQAFGGRAGSWQSDRG